MAVSVSTIRPFTAVRQKGPYKAAREAEKRGIVMDALRRSFQPSSACELMRQTDGSLSADQFRFYLKKLVKEGLVSESKCDRRLLWKIV